MYITKITSLLFLTLFPLFLFANDFGASTIILGNPSNTNASADGWISNMMINETDIYTNTSSNCEAISINKFNFYAAQLGDPVTPFLVKVHGDNDFTVLKIGTTRTSSDYVVGENSFDFISGESSTIALDPNESIAIGFLDANPNGSGSGISSVIPYDTNTADEIWYTGGGQGTQSGSVMAGQAPIAGGGIITNLNRNYHFNFEITTSTLIMTELYVSPNGDDANSGLSQSTPFATLERARDELRSLGPTSATVWLMDGDYYLNNTFSLQVEDSGTPSKRITYRAVNKYGAILHLNKTVSTSSFSPITDQDIIDRLDPAAVGNVVALDLAALGVQNMDTWPDYFPAANQDLFRLYTDTDELPLSRYPNDSMMTMETVTQNEPGIFKYRGDRHSRWLDAVDDGLWFQGYWRVAWQYDAVRTASIDTTNKIVTQAASVPGGIGDKYTRPAGNGMEPYLALNLLEEIDREGEWAVNFNNDSLYIWIPNGITEIKILDNNNPLWQMNNVSHVDIIDIKFDYGLGTAIEINNGYDNLVAGCEITNFIEDAIRLVDGFNHTILSNDLHHLGAGGIYMSGGERYTLTEAGHRAINNHIYEFGQVKVIYAPAIGIPTKYYENNVGMYVAHNKIHGTPHVGIQFCGNNNIFEYNDIYDICRVSNDMGGFYSWNDWTSYGNIIRYNYVHDAHQAHGTYFDDGDSGDEVHDNIFNNIDVGVFIGGGHDIYAHNNIAVNCEKTVHIDNRGVSRGYNLSNTGMVNRVLSVPYQSPPWSTQYPSIVDILETSYEQELPTNCEITCNVAINTPQVVDIDAATASSWGVILGTNYTDTDPNLAYANLSQIATASGYNGESCMGMIPYTQIGLFDDEYRTVCIDGIVDTTLMTLYSDGNTHLQEAINSIQSTSLVQPPSDVTFRAGNHIDLNSDFEVENGATFLAEIREVCPTTSSFTSSSPTSAKYSYPDRPKVHKRIMESEIRKNNAEQQTIYYQLAAPQQISIFLSDAKGQLIRVLEENASKQQGVHHIDLSISDLTSGRYYYTIEALNGGMTKAFDID